MGNQEERYEEAVDIHLYPIPCWVRSCKVDLEKAQLIFSSTICYATVNESMSQAQYGYNAIIGVGQSGPLTLLTAYIQFASPYHLLSTATGLAFSARALGGALGSAVLNTIINNKLGKSYANAVGGAAVQAGLPVTSIGPLLAALARGEPAAIQAVPGISPAIIGEAMNASHTVYAAAYRLAWSSIIPFVVLALICVCFLKDVSHLMTGHIEATVEHIPKEKALD